MILEIRDVGKFFNGFRALSEINMDVEERKIHAIIGPNGAGKTTLFNLISGMYDVSQGEIRFREEPITGLKPHRRT